MYWQYTQSIENIVHTANIEQHPFLYNLFSVLSRLKLNPPVIRLPSNLHLPLLIKQNLVGEIKKREDCSFHDVVSSGQAISDKVAKPNVLYTMCNYKDHSSTRDW